MQRSFQDILHLHRQIDPQQGHRLIDLVGSATEMFVQIVANTPVGRGTAQFENPSSILETQGNGRQNGSLQVTPQCSHLLASMVCMKRNTKFYLSTIQYWLLLLQHSGRLYMMQIWCRQSSYFCLFVFSYVHVVTFKLVCLIKTN